MTPDVAGDHGSRGTWDIDAVRGVDTAADGKVGKGLTTLERTGGEVLPPAISTLVEAPSLILWPKVAHQRVLNLNPIFVEGS